jgi:hypothetical protein
MLNTLVIDRGMAADGSEKGDGRRRRRRRRRLVPDQVLGVLKDLRRHYHISCSSLVGCLSLRKRQPSSHSSSTELRDVVVVEVVAI